MSFTAWYYPFYLAGVALLFWQLPQRGRLALLLVASYVFYSVWDVRFLSLILASTLVDYFASLGVAGVRRRPIVVAMASLAPLAWCAFLFASGLGPGHWNNLYALALPVYAVFVLGYALLWRLPDERRRRGFVALSITSNLSVLFFFKYFGFFVHSAETILQTAGMETHWSLVEILLPVGISFYTFQSIAYVVDVYRGRADPCPDFLRFAVFMCFFPQLVAGPIERGAALLPQLASLVRFETTRVWEAVRLLLVGFFKKIYVANNCAIVADYFFQNAAQLDFPWLALGAVAFAFQIYCDFSGYTDIARGSGLMFGVRLDRNFRFPYAARGPSDFWSRWHITLSTWFRDYVYIPLGGNRGGTALTLRNLFATMLLAGLWHGASWMFVLWGAYHGMLLALYRVVPVLRALEEHPGRMGAAAGIAVMFGLTLVGWLIFRSPTIEVLASALGAVARQHAQGMPDWHGPATWIALHVVPLLLLQIATRRAQDESMLDHRHWALRAVDYVVMFVLVATAAVIDVEFIYFQF